MYRLPRIFAYLFVLTLLIPFAVSYEGETNPTDTCDAIASCTIEGIPFSWCFRASSWAHAFSEEGTIGYYSGYARLQDVTDNMVPDGEYQARFTDGCSEFADEAKTFCWTSPREISMRANAGVSNQYGGDGETDYHPRN